MRVGVVGLGSMGKRRVRDLRALGHDVVGADLRPDRCGETERLFGVPTTLAVDELPEAGVAAVVVSTPPDEHVPLYEWCYEARLPFFSEANVLTPRVEWFAAREAASGIRGVPSATWRFHPLFDRLRIELEAIGLDRVNAVCYHYGGYLPLWHPWERYDEFYAGRSRATCAAREMVPFELEWMHWVFGDVRAVCAVRDRRREWVTDIDDSYTILLEFESGMRGTLTVELHQVAPFRTGRVSCRDHAFVLDLGRQELRRYELATDSWRFLRPPGLRTLGSFDLEQVYLEEIRAFMAEVEGGTPFPKTWAEDRHLSSVLVAAEESSRRRAWVAVAEAERLYEGVTLEAGSDATGAYAGASRAREGADAPATVAR